MFSSRTLLVAVAAALALGVSGCSDDSSSSGTEDADLTVYSGRSEEQIGDLVSRFEDESGYSVSVRYGDTAELAVQLLEEGDASPADVFWAQDAGALSAINEAGLFVELPAATLKKAPKAFQAPDGRWVGTSARARVYVYDPAQINEADLPTNVLDVAGEDWADNVAIAPTNASFQAFVTALRQSEGEDVARQWLTDLKANGATAYETNVLILDAVDAGEVPYGLINHYYWFQKEAEVGTEAMNAQIGFFESGDAGALVNVAGVGILQEGADNPGSQEFVDFLLSDESQQYTVEVSSEYPIVDGIQPKEGLPALDELQGPDIALTELADLEGTLELLTETGWI